MELFKQFTEMLENFIIGIVDKRMTERQRPNVGIPYNQELAGEVLKIIKGNEDIRGAIQGQVVAYDQHSLEQQLLKLLNHDSCSDESTPVERVIAQITKDAIPDELVTETFVEEYCGEFLDEEQVEQAVFNALRNNGHETTDIIHDNLSPDRLRDTLIYNNIVEDIAFEDVLSSDRFYTALVETMVHAIQNSDYLEFSRRVRDIVTDDDTLKNDLKIIVKDHLADNGVFEDRVCEIIRIKL